MKKKIYFLAGLPRSGSTLLGSILSQNPQITVTPTSPLLDLLCLTNESINKLCANYTFDKVSVESNVYRGILGSFYDHIATDFVVDKHRGWPRNINPVRMFIDENPKIVCTYRPVSEIVSSYILLMQRSERNFVDEHLARDGMARTVENRCRVLWENYISDPYSSTTHGIRNCRANMHFVHYSDMMDRPHEVLSGIYEFLDGCPAHIHDFGNISNACREDKDLAWGLEGLHDIRSSLGRTSPPPEEVIGRKLCGYYDQFSIDPS